MTFFTDEAVQQDPILKFLEPNPLLPSHLRIISNSVADLAVFILDTVPRSAERTAGLRKLLEAKDCFVRAGL